jgi:hypothetical protein
MSLRRSSPVTTPGGTISARDIFETIIDLRYVFFCDKIIFYGEKVAKARRSKAKEEKYNIKNLVEEWNLCMNK